MIKQTLLPIAVATLLVGCSGPSMQELAEDRVEADQVLAEGAAERRSEQQERNEDFLGDVPDWALEPPAADTQYLYAVGMAESSKLALALRKAKLTGDFSLAQEVRQELSGMEKLYESETNASIPLSQYTLVVDRFVERVHLKEEEVVHQEVVPIDGRYHAFMLLRLPISALYAAAQEGRDQDVSRSAQAAYDELQRRLDERQTQRREAEEADREYELASGEMTADPQVDTTRQQ
tara:strand:+ start:12489 stop:13193 length:705 start_codon:yes stop_codon:yes gene_type:complete